MTHQEILKNLTNKVYHPIYFLSGEEPYYIDLISDYIENKILSSEEKEFNQQIIYGKETSVDKIISECKRYPMLSDYNVIVVKEAQHLSREIEQFESYLENPTSSTILVLCYKYKTLDGRKGITKKLKKQAVFLETKKLYDNQLPQWITAYLKEKGYSINPKACLLVAEFLGTNLNKVANELNKLIINLPKGSNIDEDIVAQNISINKDFNNFELNKAVGSKNVHKATQIVIHFSQNEKEHPIQATITIFYNFFTGILKYHYAKDKSKNNIASVLKIHPFFVQDYQIASQNYSIKQAVAIINYLRAYDLKSKGVNNISVTNGELLKELVFKIMH